MIFDAVLYSLLRKYIANTLKGAGALKGASCQIQSIARNLSDDATVITFKWENNAGEITISTAVIPDGKSGSGGACNIFHRTEEEWNALTEEEKNRYDYLFTTDDEETFCISIPEGGTAGQVLTKKSGEDYDTEWGTALTEADTLKAGKVLFNSTELVHDINHLHIKKSYSGNMKLENGIFSYFKVPSSGNWWADYYVYDNEIVGGIFTLTINVVEVSGAFRIFLVYDKTDGTTDYLSLGDISAAGKITKEIDMNWYSVYRKYAGNGMNILVANRDSLETSRIIIDQYDVVTTSDSEYDNQNLPTVVSMLEAKISNTSVTEENALVAPSGEKYFPQVNNNGTVVYVPQLPNNILYIGNSALLGFGNHGMASTTIDDDYYAKINAYLTDRGKTLTTERLNGSTFEGCTTDSAVNSWITNSLAPKMSNDRQLVLIQLSDNVNTEEKRAEFTKSCGMVTSYIREHCPNARVVWVAAWYPNQENISTIKDACAKYGAKFIDISDLKSVSGNQSSIGATYIDSEGNEQTITQEGVASHPSDQGFTAIANRIITTLFE